MAQVPSNLIPTRISQLQEDPAPSDSAWMMYVRDGVTYKVQLSSVLSVSGVPTSRQVIAGTGLTGGGALISNVTLSVAPGGIGSSQLDTTGAAAGTYGSATTTPRVTVDANGRITAVYSVTSKPLTALNLDGGEALRLAYQTAPDTTGFLAAPVSANTFLQWDGSAFTWSPVAGAGTVTSVSTGTGLTGGPITSSGTVSIASTGVSASSYGSASAVATFTVNAQGQLTLAATTPIAIAASQITSGTLPVTYGGTGASDAATARSNLSAAVLGANNDITSMTGVTGGISTPDFLQLDTGATVTAAVGKLWWDGGSTLNVGMTTNVTGHVLEDQFFYVKASGALAKGEVAMFTGTVGASGVIKVAPAAGVTDGTYIVGIAAENIALNGFGLIQSFGVLRGVDTSAYADGDILWFNPAVAGGLTKVKPSAPNLKVQMAAVINGGSAGGGVLQIRVDPGSVLGGTDSNVQFGSLSNNDVIRYNSVASYWENVAQTSLSVGAATNVAGGTANQLIYNTAAGVTSFVTAPTIANTFLEWSGSAFQWSSNPLGTVTSVALGLPGEFTISGSPVTTSGTLTGAWASQTANYVFAGPTTGSPSTPGFRALVAADVPTLNQNTTGSAASLSISGQTALLTFTGLTSTNRAKTVRDAADTVLELGGSYTPNGTWNWTSASVTWPTFNQNTTGTATNATNIAVTDDTSTNATVYPLWVTASTGNLPSKLSSTKLSFNPSTGALTATGGVSGGTF